MRTFFRNRSLAGAAALCAGLIAVTIGKRCGSASARLWSTMDKEEFQVEPVTLTPASVRVLKEAMVDENLQDVLVDLRIGFIPTPEGQQYYFDFATEAEDRPNPEKDVIWTRNGFRFAVRKKFVSLLEGTEIDYLDTSSGAGFKFNNPNDISSFRTAK